MLRAFRRFFNCRRKASTATRASKAARRQRLRGEALESRAMLSLLVGESYVPTTLARDQYDVALAAAPDGRSIAVWTHSHTWSDTDIIAQRFDTAGNKVGAEIRVATTNKPELQPDVAMDDDGDFIITWVEQDSSGDLGIKAQPFLSTGARIGSVVVVADSARDEHSPSIASDAVGNFVVSWTLDYWSDQSDIRARRFQNNGIPIGATLFVASTYDDETDSDVARAPDGRFAISYHTDRHEGDIVLKRYTATGGLVYAHTVATGLNRQSQARIAMDGGANVVVAWQEYIVDDWDIRARRVTAAGSLGTVWSVSGGLRNEMVPDVALRRDGSAFVVTHYTSIDRTAIVTELTIGGVQRHRQEIATDVEFARSSVAFGAGGNYFTTFEERWNSRDTDILRRRGTLS